MAAPLNVLLAGFGGQGVLFAGKLIAEAGLIEGARRGRWIDYSLADGALERLQAALPDPARAARQLAIVR